MYCGVVAGRVWIQGSGVLACLVLAHGVALGQEKQTARLTYAVDAGCPDEASFRDLVAARL